MFYYFIFAVYFLVDFGVCTSNFKRIRRENVIQPLVYLGKPFRIRQAPYMAIYFEPHNALCGASIVHQQFLVFAAHCVCNETYVKVGTDTLDGGQIYDIERHIVHTKFNAKTADYDIAVIKLRKRLVFSDRVRPIQMAKTNMVLKAGDMMMALGFGATEKHLASQQLLKIDIPYVSRSECMKIYRPFARITKNMICAGGHDGKDVCIGDSGGPLVYRGTLVGVVSYGIDCGFYPGVYASVPALRSFVDATIKKHL